MSLTCSGARVIYPDRTKGKTLPEALYLKNPEEIYVNSTVISTRRQETGDFTWDYHQLDPEETPGTLAGTPKGKQTKRQSQRHLGCSRVVSKLCTTFISR